MRASITLVMSSILLLACSGNSDVVAPIASGGTAPLGGASAFGGSSAIGGIQGTGGTAKSGGATSYGGTPSGGSLSIGGSNLVGGSMSTGGTTATGGVAAGGLAAVGGAAIGGTIASGGTATGGATARGGAATGGAIASGGTSTGGKSTGGASSLGGSSTGGAATGGANATGGSNATGGASGSSDLLVPAQGALFGAFVGTGTVAALETTLGRKLAIIHNFFGWIDNWVARVPGDLSGGRIPLITWETWNGGVGVSLDEILNGTHDTMIRTRATAAKNVGQKFFLRWGHEMNGNWYPWDGYHNGANAAAATKYINVYRHIHDIFVAEGATNVLWVFCPNVDSVPGDAWNQWANYYPGDAYVDWMAFDGYNWGTSQTGSAWQSFTSMASRIYSSLAAKNKPIMIPETASSELGGDKAAWVASVVPALKSSYPNIKAFVWFHMNKETDWRLDSSSATRTAAISMATDAYLNP